MESSSSKYRIPILAIIALFLIWGLFGLMDMKNWTYSGYQTGADYNIINVEEGSPAETAGLMTGDRIKSIDGTTMGDSKAWNKKQRPAIGETRNFLIDRQGEEMEIAVTYSEQPASDKLLTYAAFALGIIFFLMGLWIFRTSSTKAGLIFALFAVLFGSNFFTAPYLASPFLRNLASTVSIWLILLGFAFLVNLLLNYPRQRELVDKSSARWLIFGPAVLLGLVITTLNLVQPDGTAALNRFMNLLVGLVILYYFVWAIILMIQNYSRATAEERKSKGINLMLIGAIAGLLPVVIVVLMQTLAPEVVLPAGQYAFLFFALIPVLFALAIRKGEAVATTA